MWILIWLKSNSFTLEKNPKRREKKLQASFEKADREFVATCERTLCLQSVAAKCSWLLRVQIREQECFPL